MADKVYIGKEAEAYHSSPEKEYSRVTIVVGNDEDGDIIAYTAGNDTKDELLVECPWGTQAMANALLAALAGFKYKPYTAEGTYTHPAAELGDAVTVGEDIYGGIYIRNTEYSVEPISDLSAPTTEEIDDEYDYEEPIKRELKRRIINGDNAVKASITVELGEIRLEIAGKIDSNDAQSLIQQTLNNITLSVTDGTQANTSKFVISGTGISAVSDNITLNANSINLSTATISGQLSAAKIDVAGLITAGGLVIKNDALSSVTVEYALSTSNTTAPTTGWNTVAPTWEDGKYMWQRTTWTYASGTTSVSTPTCISGATGATGTSVTILGSYNTYADLIAAHPTGNAGDAYLVGGDLYVWNGTAWQDVGQIKGDTGATGKGISSIVEQYYLSTSSSAATGGTWGTSVPAWVSGKYYWTRSHIVWSDSSESNTTEVYNVAMTQSAADAAGAADGVTAIETNIYTPGTTTINGSRITTGTVTASQIDATNLHVSAANVDGVLTIGQLPATVAETSDIPTDVSDLTNDAGYITSADVPTNVSELTNDAGYQTAANVATAISVKADKLTALTDSRICYISKAAGTISVAKPSAEVTVSTDVQNKWTLKRPTYNSSYPVLFTCVQNKTAENRFSWTTPIKDDTTTVIDGGNIITGSVTATQIAANAVTTEKLNANAVTAGKLATDSIKSRNFEDSWTTLYDATDGSHDEQIYNFVISGQIYEIEGLPLGPADDYDSGLVINTAKTICRRYTISTNEIVEYDITVTAVSDFNFYGDVLPVSEKYGLPFAGSFLNLANGTFISQAFMVSDTGTRFVGNVLGSKLDNCTARVEKYTCIVVGSCSLDEFDEEKYKRSAYAGKDQVFTLTDVGYDQDFNPVYEWLDQSGNVVSPYRLGIILVDEEEEGDMIVVTYEYEYSKIVTYADLRNLGLIT